MMLADFYFDDARLILVPIEHLTPSGMQPEFAALLTARAGWAQPRIDFFNAAFSLYWNRTSVLASRTRTWAPPRLRNVGLVIGSQALQPYVQLLNTSTWTLYVSDFDPACSTTEFAAYLFAHGDRMSLTGEVTTAALHNAAYWFDRSEAECEAFGVGAARSPRPDAAAFQALAAAIPRMRQLYHDELRPAPPGTVGRGVPTTGLLVPRSIEAAPPALVQSWTAAARDAVETFHRVWQAPDRDAATALCDWLSRQPPPLLITGHRGRMLWDSAAPTRLGALRTELRAASGAATRDILADLEVIGRHTRSFLAALTAPTALPPPHPDTEQRGYCYLHRDRHLIAYNLHEPGIERLRCPAIPYARLMVGARTIHEWAHLAVDAGWVPHSLASERVAQLTATLADQLDSIIATAPRPIQERTSSDMLALRAAGKSPGATLASIFIARMPDYQANLLAHRFLSDAEMETYIRHNIRTLRGEYTPAQLWRMLARYLAEYQYLSLSAMPDPRTYFLRSTWFDADFFASGILDDARFAAVTAAAAAISATYAIDETRFRTVD